MGRMIGGDLGGRQGIDPGTCRIADPHNPDLQEILAERALADADAAHGEQIGQFSLRADLAALNRSMMRAWRATRVDARG